MARRKDRSSSRPGEVLGLGGTDTTVNRESTTTRPASSASDDARRHRRMNEGADELVPSTESTPAQHGSGATGIDMGSSGEGTDIE